MPPRFPIFWLARLLWASLALAAGPALGSALAGASRPVQVVATLGLWAGWAVGIGLLFVPSTVSLTVLRLLAPAASAAALTALFASHRPIAGAIGLGVAVAATAVLFTGDLGRVLVQGSAYGDETRFPLRPPGPLMFGPIPIAGALAIAGAVTGPLLLAARAWIAGGILLLVGWWLAVALTRRLHRLSRRWLVFVPAGVVVHDQVALADTAMFPRIDVARMAMALADTGAADLSGAALGNAIEIGLHDLGTVVLAGTPKQPGGKALHVRSVLVAPTRPGAALAEAGRRRLPVG